MSCCKWAKAKPYSIDVGFNALQKRCYTKRLYGLKQQLETPSINAAHSGDYLVIQFFFFFVSAKIFMLLLHL